MDGMVFGVVVWCGGRGVGVGARRRGVDDGEFF